MESFETREISSPGAYLQLRPQRLPDAQWELAQLPAGVPGTKTYVLKSRKTENYLLLDEEERFSGSRWTAARTCRTSRWPTSCATDRSTSRRSRSS